MEVSEITDDEFSTEEFYTNQDPLSPPPPPPPIHENVGSVIEKRSRGLRLDVEAMMDRENGCSSDPERKSFNRLDFLLVSNLFIFNFFFRYFPIDLFSFRTIFLVLIFELQKGS
jgi:hypothetical protein